MNATVEDSDNDESQDYLVEFWCTTEGSMTVKATSEEEAIEEAERYMENGFMGEIYDPTPKDCYSFSARPW